MFRCSAPDRHGGALMILVCVKNTSLIEIRQECNSIDGFRSQFHQNMRFLSSSVTVFLTSFVVVRIIYN
jgi:hypothetical protein